MIDIGTLTKLPSGDDRPLVERIAFQAFGDAVHAAIMAYTNSEREADHFFATVWPDYAGSYSTMFDAPEPSTQTHTTKKKGE